MSGRVSVPRSEIERFALRLDQCIAVIAGLGAQLDELRAVLAPLLDDPFVGDEGEFSCQFCRVTLGPEWDATTHNHGPLRYPHRDAHLFVHAPDCPVLRKDDLLGRA